MKNTTIDMTAVEWLVEQLRMQTPLYTKDEIINEAKKMEMEQDKNKFSKEEVLAMLLIKHDGLSPEYVLEQFKKNKI